MDKIKIICKKIEVLLNDWKYGSYTEDKYRCEVYKEILKDLYSMQEELMNKRFTFKVIPRLLEMIEPTDRAKKYIAKLSYTLDVEGYSTDAKIIRERLKIMNDEKVAMTTMDEEPVNEPNKELAETYITVFDKKFPVLPTLKGKQLADYKNFLNKCQQIFGLKEWGIRPTQAKLFEKLSLLWAVWGAEHLQGVGRQDEKEQEEPVSEDLEEARDFYYDETWDNHGGRAMVIDGCHDIWFPSHATDDFFEAGAKWQQAKDQETIELAEDHAMLAGMEKMREQMMKGAIDGTIVDIDEQNIELGFFPPKNLGVKEGDKVKMIILKD